VALSRKNGKIFWKKIGSSPESNKFPSHREVGLALQSLQIGLSTFDPRKKMGRTRNWSRGSFAQKNSYAIYFCCKIHLPVYKLCTQKQLHHFVNVVKYIFLCTRFAQKIVTYIILIML
jgi:hypothetical protein